MPYTIKKKVKTNENEVVFIPKVGELVTLIGSRFLTKASAKNPHCDTKHECNGKVVSVTKIQDKQLQTIQKYIIIVEWENGYANSYNERDLMLATVEEYTTPEVFRAACDIIVGKKQIVSRGEKMYVEGDYIINKMSTVMLACSNDDIIDIFPKSYLKKKE
jgi:hypothetical protein